MRVNIKPLRQALITWVMKWILSFSAFLLQRVADAQAAFSEFAATAVSDLARPLIEGSEGYEETFLGLVILVSVAVESLRVRLTGRSAG